MNFITIDQAAWREYIHAAKQRIYQLQEEWPLVWQALQDYPFLGVVALLLFLSLALPLCLFSLFLTSSIGITLTITMAAFVIVEGSLIFSAICGLIGTLVVTTCGACAIIVSLFLCGLYLRCVYYCLRVGATSASHLAHLVPTPAMPLPMISQLDGLTGTNPPCLGKDKVVVEQDESHKAFLTGSVSENGPVTSRVLSNHNESEGNEREREKDYQEEVATEGEKNMETVEKPIIEEIGAEGQIQADNRNLSRVLPPLMVGMYPARNPLDRKLS